MLVMCLVIAMRMVRTQLLWLLFLSLVAVPLLLLLDDDDDDEDDVKETKYHLTYNIIPKPKYFSSGSSCLCPIHVSQVFSREWRCSWSSADRRFTTHFKFDREIVALALVPKVNHKYHVWKNAAIILENAILPTNFHHILISREIVNKMRARPNRRNLQYLIRYLSAKQRVNNPTISP